MEVSVVIPTFNRQKSLERLLASLSAQLHQPLEIIIIDGGSEEIAMGRMSHMFPNLEFVYEKSFPSVCMQRNIGIRLAKGSHIFLCDDDIELPEDYISKLLSYFRKNDAANIVTGSVLQKNKEGIWSADFPLASFRSLCWKFIFQQSIWVNIDHVPNNLITFIPHRVIRKFYKKRNNTFSLAGWPVITEYTYPAYLTSFYGIGASIAKKEWLLNSPYDETLDNFGIGDHYGVLANIQELRPVHVYMDTYALHHKNSENRLSDELTYYRRILALHYFMHKNKKFSGGNKLWLLWSLVGNCIVQTMKKDTAHLKASFKLINIILRNKNPYILASRKKEKLVCPLI